MIGAMVVISRAQLRTSHDSVRVRFSDASGVAIEENSWFNDSTDAEVLAVEVADHIARRGSERPDLEAIITVEG
jgi:hypothetical protein